MSDVQFSMLIHGLAAGISLICAIYAWTLSESPGRHRWMKPLAVSFALAGWARILATQSSPALLNSILIFTTASLWLIALRMYQNDAR